MKYFFGPLVLDKSTGIPTLRAPKDATATLDLRSVTAFQAGDLGPALFGSDLDLGSDYTLLVDGDINDAPKDALRADFAAALGVGTVTGVTLLDWIWSALTLHADPTGQTACKPLLPTSDLHLELHFGGKLLKRTLFDLASPEAAGVKGVLQEDYRKIRADTLGGKTSDAQLHLKVLDYWGEKYKVADPQNYFVPADLPKEAPIKHGTTLTDDFNRADQAPLGTASGGGSWQSYTSLGSGLSTDSTRVAVVSNSYSDASAFSGITGWANSRLESDLSSSDAAVQCDVTALGATKNGQIGPTVRNTTGADGTCYLARAVEVTAAIHLTKEASNGTLTDISSQSVTVSGLPKQLYISFSGSSYVVKWNGSTVLSGTDTTISSGTRGGMFLYEPDLAAATAADNWQAADLAAAVTLMAQACL